MKIILINTLLICSFLLYNGDIVRSQQHSSVPQGDPEEEKNRRSIAVVGDLQRTSIWELVLGREQNDVERTQIIKDIAENEPAMLVLLGDMVFDGSSVLQWDYFDNLVKPVKDKNIPLYPVVGNHEYWGKRGNNLSLLFKRFPFLKQKTWYARTHEGIALIFLNSNESEMGSAEWRDQKEWFKNRLYHFDNDPSIKGIFVFTHHPPYTNSTITTDEKHVQNAFVPAFTKSRKTIAFVSGHAHTYERFHVEGKMFIVSGGGGGPRVNLRIGGDCHEDLCVDDSPVRPFNYIIITKEDESIDIKVRALRKAEKEFFVLDNFSIPINELAGVTE